jgi:hypothetical protein
MPLITSKNILIIIMVRASLEENTLKGAVRTFKKDIPSISPLVYVFGIMLPTESRSKEPCGTK